MTFGVLHPKFSVSCHIRKKVSHYMRRASVGINTKILAILCKYRKFGIICFLDDWQTPKSTSRFASKESIPSICLEGFHPTGRRIEGLVEPSPPCESCGSDKSWLEVSGFPLLSSFEGGETKLPRTLNLAGGKMGKFPPKKIKRGNFPHIEHQKGEIPPPHQKKEILPQNCQKV